MSRWHRHALNKRLLFLCVLAASSVVCFLYCSLSYPRFSDINDVSALGNVKPPHWVPETLYLISTMLCRKSISPDNGRRSCDSSVELACHASCTSVSIFLPGFVFMTLHYHLGPKIVHKDIVNSLRITIHHRPSDQPPDCSFFQNYDKTATTSEYGDCTPKI